VTIWTIGHSNHSLAAFLALLQAAGIRRLVDIRTVPRSRANPAYNLDALPAALAPDGIEHRHLAALGGLRARRRDLAHSPNTLWRNDSFRNYADYALTEPFRDGLDELRRLGAERPTAIMCAEALWWRCHRRIVADYLIAAGGEVVHLRAGGGGEKARLTPGARPEPDGTILYRAEEPD
jgi:uncharacterized protein (DUF488 family)